MHGLYVERQSERATGWSVRRTDVDLVAACQSDAAILFTGAGAVAESIARRIHNASGWRHGAFVVVECGMRARDLGGRLGWLLSDNLIGIVFLRDIEKLSPVAQAELDEWLLQARAPGKTGPRCRVMASTAAPLVPDCLGGTFNDRLYYRLNLIRVDIGPPPEGLIPGSVRARRHNDQV